MMLQFKDPKKELPEEGQRVLIKYHFTYSNFPSKDGYYECTYDKNPHGIMSFIETFGEVYHWFILADVVGWMPIEELDVIPIK